MNKTNPYRVPNGGKVALVIMDQKDGLPSAFALMGTRAKTRVAIRILGGCKGMSAEDKEQMMSFFSGGLAGFSGVILSGGTRMTRDGEVDPMVTDVPGVIALENEGCVALGTMPLTDMLSLQDDSRLVLDKYGTAPNPSMSGLLIVQNGPDGSLDWDGDIETYFELMQQWRDYADFTCLATIAWNGGPVTLNEIRESANRGWPTILVEGSGRATDDVIKAWTTNDVSIGINFDALRIVSKDKPTVLNSILSEIGIVEEAIVCA